MIKKYMYLKAELHAIKKEKQVTIFYDLSVNNLQFFSSCFYHHQPPAYFLLPLWSYSIPFLPWPHFLLSPLPSFLEPSRGHYPQSPACVGLQVDMNQSVRDKNGLTALWLALGQKQCTDSLCCPSRHHPIWTVRRQHFPTCTQMRTWQQWPVPPRSDTQIFRPHS